MPGISFDRAASLYDTTRALPAGVAEQVRDLLIEQLGIQRSWRLLELGVGTGRTALPFLRAGYDYWGADLSLGMLHVLRQKLHAQDTALHPMLMQADVMSLPLRDQRFDLALTMHVLHLVQDWRAVLSEALRVLRPGGWLVLLNEEYIHTAGVQPPEQVQPLWARILDAMKVPQEQRRASAVRGLDQRFVSFLREHGASVRHVELMQYVHEPISARQMVGLYRDRIYSSCWSLPDDLHAEAAHRLEQWLETECSDPDTPYARPGRIAALISAKAQNV